MQDINYQSVRSRISNIYLTVNTFLRVLHIFVIISLKSIKIQRKSKMSKFYLLILLLINLSVYGQFYDEKHTTQALVERKENLRKQPNSSKNKEYYCEALVNLASRYNKIQKFDSSLIISNESLPLSEKLGNNFLIASSKLNIGYAYECKELYFVASKYFGETIESAKLAQNDSLLALSYYLGGMCYSGQKAYRQALDFLKKGEDLCKNKHLYNQLTRCLNIEGIIYGDLKKPEIALTYFKECLDVSEKYHIERMTAISYKNVGKILLYTKTPQEGIKFIEKSIDLFLKSNKQSIKDLVIYSYAEMAKYYQSSQDFEQANHYAQLGIQLNKSLKFTDLQLEFSKVLYQNHASIGKTAEALQYLEKYKEATDKTNQDLLQQQHVALEERVKSEQQKTQITLLNQENEIEKNHRNWLIFSILIVGLFAFSLLFLNRTIRKQKSEIEEINENLEQKVQERTAELQGAYDEIKEALMMGQSIERKRVAAELHDNLGSMISAIGLSMEIVDEEQLSEKERKIFQAIQGQVEDAYQEIRLLSHNLHSVDLENHGLKFALGKLKDKINSTHKIKLSLEAETLQSLPKDIEFNLYAICLELINNTLKHAQATTAKILFLQDLDDTYSMEYSDNGIGFQKNMKDGFGMQSIKNRVQQMGAILSTVEDNGLKYLISLEK